MWELWADAPDEVAQEMLDSGMRKRANFDLLGAIADFDRLVSYCPDYAEGYNQRAFALFIARDYARALPDLERAVGLSPDHTGARSGLALTLMQLGRLDEARAALRQALDRNPWLTERHLMEGDGPLAEPGEDI
jgi:tetratricopeptide (TPR) repeat protein